MSLNKFFKLIDEAIQALGVSPESCRTDLPNKWYLHRGDADMVLFFRETTLADGTMQYGATMVTPIVAVPTEPTEKNRIYERVLDLNHFFPHERFSVHSGVVYLSTLIDLNQHTAVEDLRLRIQNYSTYAAGFVAELRATQGEA